MNEPVAAAIELVGATARWSAVEGRYRMRGTLWYGMMCRSFLLLERTLRLTLQQIIDVDPKLGKITLQKVVGGKPIAKLTFGQCFFVVDGIYPAIENNLLKRLPRGFTDISVLSESDRELWREAINRRNRMAHEGPGFFDSVDFNAGRAWREYRIDEPLGDQARRAWELNRYLARSRLVLAAIHLSGTPINIALEKMDVAELIGSNHEKNLASAGNSATIDINEFHSRIETELAGQNP